MHKYVKFREEEFKPECLNLTVKHPLKVDHCLGCMGASDFGRLHIVNGTVNATKYIGAIIAAAAVSLLPHRFMFQNGN